MAKVDYEGNGNTGGSVPVGRACAINASIKLTQRPTRPRLVP
jgi:hypothetical protein